MTISDEDVKAAAAGIHRLFIERDLDEPTPTFLEMARAAISAMPGQAATYTDQQLREVLADIVDMARDRDYSEFELTRDEAIENGFAALRRISTPQVKE